MAVGPREKAPGMVSVESGMIAPLALQMETEKRVPIRNVSLAKSSSIEESSILVSSI